MGGDSRHLYTHKVLPKGSVGIQPQGRRCGGWEGVCVGDVVGGVGVVVGRLAKWRKEMSQKKDKSMRLSI